MTAPTPTPVPWQAGKLRHGAVLVPVWGTAVSDRWDLRLFSLSFAAQDASFPRAVCEVCPQPVCTTHGESRPAGLCCSLSSCCQNPPGLRSSKTSCPTL